MKAQNAVTRLDTPVLSQFTIPVLENLDLQRENRTGVSRMTQGLDPSALTSNTAATAVNQVMSAAQSKILLIARIFAETGVKELMWQLYQHARTHQTEADFVKLRGKFVEVNPFDWRDRKDMTVTVGIGNGNKDQQMFHLNNISQLMQQIGSSDSGYLISDQNVYELATEFIKNSGYKNTDRFITPPEKAQKPPPQPNPAVIEAEGEAMKDKEQAGLYAAQAEQQNIQNQLAPQKVEIEAAKMALEEAKFEWTKKVEAAELAVEASQDRPVGIGENNSG